MKRSIKFGIAFLLGAAVASAYDTAAWNYHLSYIGLNWLGPLIGADGERGYDAMLYESMIDLGVASLLLLMAFRFLFRKFRSSSWPPTP